MRTLPLLLVAATLAAPVTGWVSRTELLSKKRRISCGALRAVEDDEDTETIQAYRERLESRFSAFGDHAHDFFGASSPLMTEDDSWIESEWSDESTMACGDDCEVSEKLVCRVEGQRSTITKFVSPLYP